jgi:hypothetical protein
MYNYFFSIILNGKK